MYELIWSYLFPILILHNVPYPLSYIKLDCQSHSVCLSPVWFMSDDAAKLVRNIIGKIGKVGPFRIERNQTNNDLTLVPGSRYLRNVNWALWLLHMCTQLEHADTESYHNILEFNSDLQPP